MRLSPRDPEIFWMESATALAHLCAGRYAEASSWAEQALSHKADQLPSLAFSAAADSHLGRHDRARATMARLLEIEPRMCIETVRSLGPSWLPEHFSRFAEGLRRAGMPE